MKFQAKTEKQIKEELLWEKGQYAFEVADAFDEVSKKGNDMIHLKLKVFNENGKFIFVDDYLLESMAFKLLHASEACGLADQYNAGSLVAEDFKGKSGYVDLYVQESEGYADKNAVKDYVSEESEGRNVKAETAVMDKAKTAIADDEIPF